MNGVFNKRPQYFHLPENISDALRNVMLIIIPLLIGYRQAPELTTGIAVGALMISLTDLPGNKQRKIKTAWQSVLVAAVVSFVFNTSLANPIATGVVLCIFSFVLALWNGFGTSAGAIGMSGIAMMIFMLGFRPEHAVSFSAYMLIGAVWFHLVVLLQIYIRPFRSLTQELEDLVKLTADFLSARANCYEPSVPLEKAYQDTMKLHLRVMAKQDAVRELLLTDPTAMRQANGNVRQLLSTAILTIQLYEHFIATPLDHGRIREVLKDSDASKQITSLIREQANTLRTMSKSILSARATGKYDDESHAIETSLKDIAERSTPEQAEIIHAVLKNAYTVRSVLSEMTTNYANIINPPHEQLQRFLPHSKGFKSTLASILHWHSPVLRFSLRLTLMLSVAYWAVFALSTDHYNYWFLLTILVVSRPRVAITWKRNLERVIGTVLGLAVAYALLTLISSPAILLAIAAVCLIVFYALNRIRYDRSVFAITICAVLFASVYAGSTTDVLYARLLYTFAGCALALAGIFFFPVWVKAELDAIAVSAIASNKELLNAVSNNENEFNIRLARKEVHQHIARLFEGLQHAQYEPGVPDLTGLKSILLINYRLNSVILSLFLFDEQTSPATAIHNACRNLSKAKQEIETSNNSGQRLANPELPPGISLLEMLTLELLSAVRDYNFTRQLTPGN